MAGKSKRSGGKYTGNHTTLTPTGAVVADIADGCSSVTKISPGFIKSGLRPAKGRKRLKITEKDGGLLLSVRGNISHQELHIFASDIEVAKEHIERESKALGFIVRN